VVYNLAIMVMIRMMFTVSFLLLLVNTRPVWFACGIGHGGSSVQIFKTGESATISFFTSMFVEARPVWMRGESRLPRRLETMVVQYPFLACV